jgi:hypothetical protein
LEQAKTQVLSGHARALRREADVWLFGAGAQAITPVSRTGAELYKEHGLSRYTRGGKEALTPGHTTTAGVDYKVFDPGAQILRCFQCHSTGPVRFSEEHGIAVAEEGVRCEVCHGPGGDHVRAGGGRLNIFQPRNLNGSGVNDFCGNCHRMPPAAGEDVDWTDAWNTRHQPVYLSQSACFRASQGRLNCFTCHDPHNAKPVRMEACGDCHASPKHTRPLAKGQTCTGCHMPSVPVSAQLRFANHWIGIYAPNDLKMPRTSK